MERDRQQRPPTTTENGSSCSTCDCSDPTAVAEFRVRKGAGVVTCKPGAFVLRDLQSCNWPASQLTCAGVFLSWTIYVRQGRGRKQSNPGALQLWVVENLTAPRCIVWVQTGMQMQKQREVALAAIFCCCLCAKQARGQGSCTRTTATNYQLHSQQLREQRSAASPACSVSLLTRDAWENGCRSLHTLTPKPYTSLIRTTTFGTQHAPRCSYGRSLA